MDLQQHAQIAWAVVLLVDFEHGELDEVGCAALKDGIDSLAQIRGFCIVGNIAKAEMPLAPEQCCRIALV